MAWTHTRSAIAVAKHKNPNADVRALQLQLKAERLAAHIEQVVNSAPPLSAEQRNRIAELLTGGAG